MIKTNLYISKYSFQYSRNIPQKFLFAEKHMITDMPINWQHPVHVVRLHIICRKCADIYGWWLNWRRCFHLFDIHNVCHCTWIKKTQNTLPMHRKMCILLRSEDLAAPTFAICELVCVFEHPPPGPASEGAFIRQTEASALKIIAITIISSFLVVLKL